MPSQSAKKVLIVGAGPTGLTAAFELARRGIVAQVIDAKDGISPLSRAVGISGSTLKLLEDSGVAERLVAAGVSVRDAKVTMGEKEHVALDFARLPHKYNFLLALPQNRTEEIMRTRLEELGGGVAFGTALISLAEKEDGTIEAVMEKNGKRLTETFNAVIGADGINSKVRAHMGVKAEERTYPHAWSAAEFDSRDWPYPPEEIQYFFGKGGKFAVVVPLGGARFRAVANTEDALACIEAKFTIDKLHCANPFDILVRHVKKYQKGGVFLAGDAAHVYPPAGAQGGMNLGIKDACSLARRIAEGKTKGYTRERRAEGKATIRNSQLLVRVAEMKNRLASGARNKGFRAAMHVGLARRQILKKSLGL
jgi:2-polyprenyl-6-methoxyphenol hydroxylase-like FAD-dependent oxidoreductase